jgi:glycosyltransferase involved in cell wall biosynthesis
MKILLVGEYSNLHNTLKLGLEANGHDVLLIGTGDAFKQYPVDINVRGRFFQDNTVLNFLRQIIFRLTKFDIAALETHRRTTIALKKLGSFDVIQLINEYPFQTPYPLERKLIKKLAEKTVRLVLLASSDDYIYLNNIDKLPHHPMRSTTKNFPYSDLYLTKRHKRFHDFVFSLKKQVISTDFDYHTIYKDENLSDYFGMIPNPVNLDALSAVPFPAITEKIIIFHGINRSNYYKKGNDLFEKALGQIKREFKEKVEIITAESLPYTEYIKKYDTAHIVLDQTYALDQGYNALEAMAKGKVVFTGAGDAFCAFYNLPENSVAIHTIPDAEKIAKNLQKLLKNPEKLVEISENAREFIERYHDYEEIAEKYVRAWEIGVR